MVTRDFCVLWQDLQQPRPFRLDDGAPIVLCGTALDLVEDTGRTAFCTWDAEEMCPVLIVEGRTAVQRVLLSIQDGEPCIDEQHPSFIEDTEVTYGERLEVVYDILDHLRRDGRPAPFIRRIFVRDLTAETHGNAIGIGLADVTTTRLVRAMDVHKSFTNAMTALTPQSAKLPV